MKAWKECSPEELNRNPFHLIGKEWMLVTAKNEEKEPAVNTMTASWGGVGVMWNKNVVYIVIRPQRYTKEFIDFSDTFSLTFLDEAYRKQLGYLGKVSGRDEDKIQNSGLTVALDGNTPYIEEGNLVLLCRKLYRQPMVPGAFLEPGLDTSFYPNKDYHVLYVAEIMKILEQ